MAVDAFVGYSMDCNDEFRRNEERRKYESGSHVTLLRKVEIRFPQSWSG
jgi:hypothetical protein